MGIRIWGFFSCENEDRGKSLSAVTIRIGIEIILLAMWRYLHLGYIDNLTYKIDIYYIFNIKIKKIQF